MIKKKFNNWYPVVLWAMVIFFFSSLPTIVTTKFFLWDFLFKKSAHFVEYAILATLTYRAFLKEKVKNQRAIFFAVIFSFIYAITDEYHQSFVPGRGPAVRDIIIDTLGAIFATYGLILNKSKLPISLQNMYNKFIL